MPRSRALPWLMWGLGAAYYAYGFFQRVAPSVMVEELMRDLAVGGAMLGGLSAAYFYAYAAVQIPVGVLLDRLGPRRLLIAAALLASGGGFVFAAAGAVHTAILGRALVGLGAGFAYISALKLAASWFPPERFGLVAGLTLAVGLVGGLSAQVPLAGLVVTAGWRPTMTIFAALGLGLALAMLLLLRDRPDLPAEAVVSARPAFGLWQGLGRVLARRETWLLAAITGMVGGPILTFAGLWGVPYLVHAHGLSRPQAGLVTSTMLAAWAAGGPLCGWLSDRLGRRRPVLLGGALLSFLVWSVLVAWPTLPIPAQLVGCVAIGLAGGCMVVAFAAAKDHFGVTLAGSAMGVVNSSVLLVGAALQTLTGILLDAGWTGTMTGGGRIYDLPTYQGAFVTFTVASGLAIAAALALADGRRPT